MQAFIRIAGKTGSWSPCSHKQRRHSAPGQELCLVAATLASRVKSVCHSSESAPTFRSIARVLKRESEETGISPGDSVGCHLLTSVTEHFSFYSIRKPVIRCHLSLSLNLVPVCSVCLCSCQLFVLCVICRQLCWESSI